MVPTVVHDYILSSNKLVLQQITFTSYHVLKSYFSEKQKIIIFIYS